MTAITKAEREVLKRMAKPGHWEPFERTPVHNRLEARGLIQWAKPGMSTVEWEITKAGKSVLKSKK